MFYQRVDLRKGAGTHFIGRIEATEEHIPYLLRKAEAIERYLQQR